MPLRGKPPSTVEKRLKALFYGRAGVGKTTAAIQFPRPYLIDTERGAENDQYVKLLKEAGGAYLATSDPKEVIAELQSLITEKHEYRTVIIDPLTVIYNDLLDTAAEEVGTDYGRHKGPANRAIKRLLGLLLRVDMNVIITSHAKPKWVRSKDHRGKDAVAQEGQTYDCYDGLDYLFDLVFEIEVRGKERVGIVKKTRVEGFPEGDVFPFSYDAIAEKYGRAILEREAVAQAFVSKEKAAELRELLSVRADAAEKEAAWLKKANADSLDELPADIAEKCIAFLKSGKP